MATLGQMYSRIIKEKYKDKQKRNKPTLQQKDFVQRIKKEDKAQRNSFDIH